jgi:hypothetical protein
MHHRIMIRSERESTNEIARFWGLKRPIPAISNASAAEKQTPTQPLRGLFTDDWRLPVFPYEQTSSALVGMSQTCQEETHASQQIISLTVSGRASFRRHQLDDIPVCAIHRLDVRGRAVEAKLRKLSPAATGHPPRHRSTGQSYGRCGPIFGQRVPYRDISIGPHD